MNKRQGLNEQELANISSAVDEVQVRGDTPDLGAPRTGESLDAIIARAERMRQLANEAKEEEQGVEPWHQAERKAAIYAQALQQQEVRDRLSHSQKNTPRRDEEGARLPREKVPHVPRMVVPRAAMWDTTTIRDPETGESLVKEGMMGRWVRVDEVSQFGAVRRSAARLHNFIAWGAEVVRDQQGKPVTSIYGVAVQGPPEVFAARSARAAPTGTLNRQDLLTGTADVIASFNKKRGERQARLVAESEHGVKAGKDGEDSYAPRSI